MFPFYQTLDWAEDGASWPHQDRSEFVTTQDHRWHVQRAGSGPTIILIHGAGASTHSWADVFAHLVNDFDVICFDLPGHGFTSRSRTLRSTLPSIARRTAALFQKISAEPAIIVGHSAGAAIMVRMIAEGLIAPSVCVGVNSALTPFRGPAGVMFPLMAKLLFYNPFTANVFAFGASEKRRVRRLINQTGSAPPQKSIDCYAKLIQTSSHVAGVLDMMAHWDLSNMANDLQALPKNSLFLAGENDKAVPPSDSHWAASIAPAATSKVLPDYGHLLHEEAPELTVKIIRQTAVAAGLLQDA
ncbi:MAG: alpha/beta fold hydrolase BchO [Pseudomonadota bacterium]